MPGIFSRRGQAQRHSGGAGRLALALVTRAVRGRAAVRAPRAAGAGTPKHINTIYLYIYYCYI
eukprot:8634998-Pyramimonas_sp.AAC.1